MWMFVFFSGRALNGTFEGGECLMHLKEKRKNVIQNNRADAMNISMKEREWEVITTKLNEMSNS